VSVTRYRYAPRRHETLAYTGTMADAVRGSAAASRRSADFWSRRPRARARGAAWRADVVHAHWWFPGGASAAAPVALGRPPLCSPCTARTSASPKPRQHAPRTRASRPCDASLRSRAGCATRHRDGARVAGAQVARMPVAAELFAARAVRVPARCSSGAHGAEGRRRAPPRIARVRRRAADDRRLGAGGARAAAPRGRARTFAERVRWVPTQPQPNSRATTGEHACSLCRPSRRGSASWRSRLRCAEPRPVGSRREGCQTSSPTESRAASSLRAMLQRSGTRWATLLTDGLAGGRVRRVGARPGPQSSRPGARPPATWTCTRAALAGRQASSAVTPAHGRPLRHSACRRPRGAGEHLGLVLWFRGGAARRVSGSRLRPLAAGPPTGVGAAWPARRGSCSARTRCWSRAGGRSYAPGETSCPFWGRGAIWSVSNLGRYVPGKLWSIGAMGLMAQRAGVSPVARHGIRGDRDASSTSRASLAVVCIAGRRRRARAVPAARPSAAAALPGARLRRAPRRAVRDAARGRVSSRA
jgi:hypothetical protein